MSETDIAIVGMSCRLPGAETLAEMRAALTGGRDMFTTLSDAELLAAGLNTTEIDDPAYVKRAPLLRDIAGFDADFFGLSATEADLMDPQHRLFLECAVEALEDAAVAPSQAGLHVGVFAGASISSYLLFNLLPQFETGASSRTLMAMSGNEKDYLASHTAYLLGLQGPALGIQTACSSSLVAVHVAVQSLLSNECDLALAGGVTVRVPHRTGYRHEPGSILSASGICRSFDASADGTVFGSGAGVVALCRAEDARLQGRPIYAVIRATAVNNDGRNKAGFTAPGFDGQTAVVSEAMAVAGLSPADIGYIEAHGTGTPIGDPIEIRALDHVYGGQVPQGRRIPIGAAKAIFGHLEAASGVVGLMSAALSLDGARLPAVPNFTTPNPALKLDATPFRVSSSSHPWPEGLPRTAAVSSFGIGGTNAHAILAAETHRPQRLDSARPHIYAVSGHSDQALHATVADHDTLLQSGQAFAALARTSTLGRESRPHRAAIVACSAPEGARALAAAQCTQAVEKPQIGFVFAGQGGGSWPDVATLRDRFDPFRATMDRAAALLPHLAPTLNGHLPADPADTGSFQALLFVLQASLVETLRSMNIPPHATCGHSAGEIAAAWAADMMSFDDALRFADLRGRLMAGLPPGAMAVTSGDPETFAEYLAQGISIAATNGAHARVLSGPDHLVEKMIVELTARGVDMRRLPGHVAFHSAAVSPILADLNQGARSITQGAASRAFVSSLTGQLETALPSDHWGRHARAPVSFDTAIQSLTQTGTTLLLEIGPGAGLTALLRSQEPDLAVIPTLGGRGDDAALLSAVAQLFAHGCAVKWDPLDEGVPFGKLPHTPFQRKRHWLDAPPPPPLKNRAPVTQSLWPDRPDWLAQHRVDGKTVMPAAGFLSFALAATGLRRIGAVTFERLLEIGADGTELRLTQRDSQTCTLDAQTPGQAPVRLLSLDLVADAHAAPLTPLVREDLAAIDTAGFYAKMRGHGIDLGPPLQKLSQIRAEKGKASAIITVVGNEAHGFGAPLHPAVLDAMFQVLGAAVDHTADTPIVPAALDSLDFRADALPSGLYQCDALLRPDTGDANTLIGDIALFDDKARCIAEVKGLRSRAVGARKVDFLYDVTWVESHTRPLPAPSDISTAVAPPPMDHSRHASYLSRIDRLAGAYVANALESLEPGRVDSVRFGALLERYRRMLQEDGPQSVPPAPDPLLSALQSDFPDYALETSMLARCGAQLAQVLLGEVDPLNLLFHSGTQETGTLYAQSASARALNDLLVRAVAQATDGQTALSVLEIGGGTGGTTHHLVPALENQLSRYLFTDISPGFLDSAAQRFQHVTGFETARFDVDQAPGAQSLDTQRFDMVVAANVLHAAPDLARAVTHTHETLKDGGWLVLVEGFTPSRWLDLTFGLTKGWWSRTDHVLRPDYPLLSSKAWDKLLRDNGFDDVAVLTPGPDESAQQGIVLARKARLEAAQVTTIASTLTATDPAAEVLRDLQATIAEAPRLLVATQGAAHVRPCDTPDPQQAAVAGMAKAAALEHAATDLRIVDLDPFDPDADAVLRIEAQIDDQAPYAAWRDGQRYVERLSPSLPPPLMPKTFHARYTQDANVCRFEDLVLPDPAPDHVEIEVHAAGVNFKDILTQMGMVPPAGGPGGECAGVVTRVGAEVIGFAPGARVMAVTSGSFASHVHVPVARVVPVPPEMTLNSAAGLPVVGMTAHYIFAKLKQVEPGHRVLIHTATGGVGLCALELAKRAGAEIFATAGSRTKRGFLRQKGVDHVFSSRDTGFAEATRTVAPDGLDLVINTLSGQATEAGLGLLKPGGCFVELGRTNILTTTEVHALRPDIDYQIVALDELSDVEGGNLLRAAVQEIAQTGFAVPPLMTMPMAQLPKSIATMKAGAHIGKIVLTNPPRFVFKTEASYLITGGTGALGLEVAEWAGAAGAGHLHLTTRRALDAQTRARIGALQESGTEVSVHRLDLADLSQVDDLLQAIADGPKSLDGVFHAAGQLDDALLADMTLERLRTVAAPKANLAEHLAQRLPALSFFALFSSAAGTLGSPGQSNHAAASASLDAIAHTMRRNGQRALSIDWGAWDGIGAAHERGAAARLKGSFVGLIPPPDGIRALEMALEADATRQVALPLDLGRLADSKAPPIFDGLVETIQTPSPDAKPTAKDGLDNLGALSPQMRRTKIAKRVEDEARRLMSLQGRDLPHGRPLQELGLDSLMSVELRNRLNGLVGTPLPATLLFNHPTIEALARCLDEVLHPETPEPTGENDCPLIESDDMLNLDESEIDDYFLDMERQFGDDPS